MRLFLLPISSRRTLIHCQRLNQLTSSTPTIADRATSYASKTWLKWEKGEKGWQKRVTAYGNKLFEQIPHEEWGLKSVPPLSQRRRDEELKGKDGGVKVEFPGRLIPEEKVWESLRWFAGKERQGFHTKWMWGSILGMPVTAPVALVPVSSTMLDSIYSSPSSPFSSDNKNYNNNDDQTKSATPPPNPSPQTLLLTPSHASIIASKTQIPELEEEIVRAVKQVSKAISAAQELEEEKTGLDRSTLKKDDQKTER
ncbi:MAG: hypothetical protein Q9190_003196 [Brigantiaea leucoxantha]